MPLQSCTEKGLQCNQQRKEFHKQGTVSERGLLPKTDPNQFPQLVLQRRRISQPGRLLASTSDGVRRSAA